MYQSPDINKALQWEGDSELLSRAVPPWQHSAGPGAANLPLVVGGELSVCRGTVGLLKGTVCSFPEDPDLNTFVKQSSKVLEHHFPPSAKGE